MQRLRAERADERGEKQRLQLLIQQLQQRQVMLPNPLLLLQGLMCLNRERGDT